MSRKITLNNFLVFEPDKKRIIGRGHTAVISASASLCLELLIENVGHLVTHQQFYDYVWRRFGTEPASTTLYQNISTLRRALNKAGLQEDIIRTMPRKGFLLSPQTTIEKEINPSPSSVITEPESAETLPAVENIMADQSASDQKVCTEKNEEHCDSANKRFLHAVHMKSFFSQIFLKSKKMVAVTILLLLAIILLSFFYIRAGMNYDDTVFVYSAEYKGCTLFNNSDAWLKPSELKKKVDEMNLNCSVSPYVYLTAFKHADSFSYFNCEHPLKGPARANCRSHYYVKNLNND